MILHEEKLGFLVQREYLGRIDSTFFFACSALQAVAFYVFRNGIVVDVKKDVLCLEQLIGSGGERLELCGIFTGNNSQAI
mmetsp:Transcript_16820/g.27891  ORF Transcript_16820/g.27891 Transcript_16820/m.27891 type:complete len:80 (+) Transcript_16820:982-1221(+)